MAWLGAGIGNKVILEDGVVLMLEGDKPEALGRGAEGIVYPCKLKIGRDGDAKVVDAAVKCRFLRGECEEDQVDDEYENWEKASEHENVVKLYGRKVFCGHDAFDALLVCERMQGDLRQLIETEALGEEFLQEEALDISIQIGKGLKHVHECGLIHMDLKPANVLISKRPCGGFVAKITDFGHSVLLKDGRQSTTVTFRGTLYYQAPEVYSINPFFIGDDRITQFADVYSLGMVVCTMFNRRKPPFNLASHGNKIRVHGSVNSCEVSCEAPDEVCQLIQKCLLFDDPNDHSQGHGRPTVKEFVEEIERIRNHAQTNTAPMVLLPVSRFLPLHNHYSIRLHICKTFEGGVRLWSEVCNCAVISNPS